VLIEPPRADGHDLRLGLIEHLSVVGVGFGSLQALNRFGPALFIRIGDRNDFTPVFELRPNQIMPMAIVSAARMTNDSDAIFRHVIHTGSKFDNASSEARGRVLFRSI
jgi:hypothetical protein